MCVALFIDSVVPKRTEWGVTAQTQAGESHTHSVREEDSLPGEPVPQNSEAHFKNCVPVAAGDQSISDLPRGTYHFMIFKKGH